MSTGFIITAIAIMLGMLMAFAFISNLQQRRREQQNRLASALKARSRKLMNMLSSYPKHYLSVDLQTLLLNQLIKTTETLISLEPKTASHQKNLTTLSERQLQLQNPANAAKKATLTDTEQMQVIQKNLESLYLFIRTLAQKQEISADEANTYNHQVKQLTFELSTGYNEICAKRALKAGKTKVALHHFSQVMTLHKGNETFGDQARILKLEPLIAELTAKQEEERAQLQQADSGQSETKEGWNDMTEGDDLWKKKTVYD